eukprot:TRINITY_DN672_c0_g1_i2.p1 TRINITY_DN672_c0_g1~~TRINITY_DN672_c0_g1_i2.p1  ORF type:complete len:274 (+),score=79.75 TRINITY_DN672_c0_g1_i2:131-952(+)
MVSQLQQLQQKDNEKQHKKQVQRLGAILVLCKVQAHMNTETGIKMHFDKFGKVNLVLCSVTTSKAYVVFAKVSECTAAKESFEAVMGNRFIMVYPCGTSDVEDMIKIPLKPFQVQKSDDEIATMEKDVREAKALLEGLESQAQADPEDETMKADVEKAAATLAELQQELSALKASKASNEAVHTPVKPTEKKPWWATTRSNTFDNRSRKLTVSNIPESSSLLKQKDHFAQFGEVKTFEPSEETVIVEYSLRWQAEKCQASLLATEPDVKVEFM